MAVQEKKPPSVSFSRRGRLFGTKPLILSLSHKKASKICQKMRSLPPLMPPPPPREDFFVPPVPKSGVFWVGGGGVRAKKKLRVFCDFSPLLTKACRECDTWRIFFEVVFLCGEFREVRSKNMRVCENR